MHPTLAGLYPFLLGSPARFAFLLYFMFIYIYIGSPARSPLSRFAVALTGRPTYRHWKSEMKAPSQGKSTQTMRRQKHSQKYSFLLSQISHQSLWIHSIPHQCKASIHLQGTSAPADQKAFPLQGQQPRWHPQCGFAEDSGPDRGLPHSHISGSFTNRCLCEYMEGIYNHSSAEAG